MQGGDAAEVRNALQAKLAKAEVDDCRILNVEPIVRAPANAARYAPRVAPAEGAWRKQSNAAGLILLLTLGWAAWFFWSFLSLYLGTE
ncbi:MAG TPA: hypothetical protein ENO14_04705 [Chromatiales bacterium]|nr:hypothetical protein [Chromatiales bacterium]